jgi:hypothetical protein
LFAPPVACMGSDKMRHPVGGDWPAPAGIFKQKLQKSESGFQTLGMHPGFKILPREPSKWRNGWGLRPLLRRRTSVRKPASVAPDSQI